MSQFAWFSELQRPREERTTCEMKGYENDPVLQLEGEGLGKSGARSDRQWQGWEQAKAGSRSLTAV